MLNILLSLKWRKTTFMILAVVLFGWLGLQAQEITGRVLGSVADSSGAAVPNAQITITNQDNGSVRNAVSGVDGLYNIPQVPVGTYTIQAKAQGFSPVQVRDAVVTVGTDTRVDLKVQVGAVTQTVTVTEAVPLVDTTSSSVGSTVDEQRVADLPLNGRNWTNLTLLQPGITQVQVFISNTPGVAGYNGTTYSSNGAPITSNAIMIDGASEKNIIGLNNESMVNTSLGVDGIEEYKVVTNLFSAEYGMSMGSQTTVVSKGGTNQFHGDAYNYLRNSSLDARNYFDALDTADVNGSGTDKSVVYPGKRIPPFRRNDFGGAFGGPIKKDKTFFYAVYEGIRMRTGQTITYKTFPLVCFVDLTGATHATIPAVIKNAGGACSGSNTGPVTVSPLLLPFADLFPQPNVTGYPTFNYTFPYLQPASENFGQIRIDHNFSVADTVFLRHTHDDSNEVAIHQYLPYLLNQASSSQFTTLGENHVVSPTVLNTARFSVSRTDVSNVPSIDTTAPNAPGNLLLTPNPLNIMGDISPGGGITAVGGDTSEQKGLIQTIYTLSDDIFWTKGKHAFKFGTLINYFYDGLINSQFAPGSVAFASLANFFNADYSSISYQPTGAFVPANYRYLTYGFYAQDDFRVSNRLTLNLGLRYEFATVPFEPNPSLAYSIHDPLTDTTGVPGPMFRNPSLHDFSPRIGFAWDPFGRGKTSIRGGAGIYYDVGLYGGLFHSLVDATPPAFVTITVTNAAATPAVPLTVPLPTNLPLQSQLVRGIDYNLPEPTLLQHSLEIDQQLPWAMGLSIGYVGSRGWHIEQEEEGNPIVSVAADQRGLPIYGCWNASQTAYQLANAAGSCPTGFTTAGPRTNPAFGSAQMTEDNGDSYYNAVQIQLNKRISQGLQFQFSYTLSKLIDDGEQQDPTINTELTQAPFNEYDDRGPAVFDSPQNLRFNMIYHAPIIQSDKLAAKLLNGWWFSSIVSAQSGYPFSPLVSSDRELQNLAPGYGNVERLNLDPSFNAHKDILGKVAEWYDPTEFDLQPAGHLGDAGRNILRGPGYEDVDFSIVKDTKVAFLGEAGNIEFRGELFNLLNHPNFALPSTTVYSGSGAAGAPPAGQIQPIGSSSSLAAFASAGQITSTVSNSRQIQFALKIVF